MEEQLILWGAGVLGAAYRAIAGYRKSGKKFNRGYFFRSVIIPALSGGLAGAVTGDPMAAFAAGMAIAEGQSLVKAELKK